MRIEVLGTPVNYRLEGPSSAPVILMSHALGTNLSMWDMQAGLLARNFRVLRYDILGHGQTAAPSGPYTLDQLTEQAAGLLNALGLDKIHFLGLSLGGMIAQRLAILHPERIASLMLCDTTSLIPREAGPLWEERIRIVESSGMEPLVEPTISRWFTPAYRATHPEVLDRVKEMIRSTSTAGYAGCCHAVAKLDLTAGLSSIQAKTIILVGEEDPGTPVSMSRTIHENIDGSELVILPAASHLSNMEQPEAFNQAILSFLQRAA